MVYLIKFKRVINIIETKRFLSSWYCLKQYGVECINIHDKYLKKKVLIIIYKYKKNSLRA